MTLAVLLYPWRLLCLLQFLLFVLIVVLCLTFPTVYVWLLYGVLFMAVYFQCAGDATVSATTVDCPAGIQSLDSTDLASTFTLANWETIAGLVIAIWAVIFVFSQLKRLIETF